MRKISTLRYGEQEPVFAEKMDNEQRCFQCSISSADRVNQLNGCYTGYLQSRRYVFTTQIYHTQKDRKTRK